MARTEVTVHDVGLNGAVKIVPVNLDGTNDHFVAYTKDNVMLVVSNTDSSNSLGIKVLGENGNSDVTFTIKKSETHVIGNLESAKFKDADGNINIDLVLVQGASASGTIYAIQDLI